MCCGRKPDRIEFMCVPGMHGRHVSAITYLQHIHKPYGDVMDIKHPLLAMNHELRVQTYVERIKLSTNTVFQYCCDFAHRNGKQRSNDISLFTSVTHLHFIKAMFRSCSCSPLWPTRPSFDPSNARALLSLSDGGCKQTGICGDSYIRDDKRSAFRRIHRKLCKQPMQVLWYVAISLPASQTQY